MRSLTVLVLLEISLLILIESIPIPMGSITILTESIPIFIGSISIFNESIPIFVNSYPIRIIID